MELVEDRAPETTRTALEEIARSEASLRLLMTRSERLHAARVEHDPVGCLVCFAER